MNFDFNNNNVTNGDVIITKDNVYMIIKADWYYILDMIQSKLFVNSYDNINKFATPEAALRYIKNDLKETVKEIIKNNNLLLSKER